jgi:PHD/YefM family antitoxin component YafN of YafNO toxin-antitoxin module
VLTNNRPSFYVLPPELYDQLAELIYDIEISKVVEKRLAENRPRVKVRIEDL